MPLNTTIRSRFKQTEIGMIPEDWEVAKLSELFAFANGVNADKNAYGEGVRFINVLEVINHPHIRSTDVPGLVRLDKATQNSFAVRRGDILFNRTSETQEEVGLTSVYDDDDDLVVFGGFVIRGRPKTTRIDVEYSGYAFRSPAVRRQIIAKGQGAIRANIGQADLKKVQVPIPKISEQRAIAGALSDVDALVDSLDKLILKIRDLKQAAMQQLLTGKKRLPEFCGQREVKPRYGQTEAGVIPEDWGVGKLGDCLTSKPDYGINAAAVPFAYDLPVYIRITDITENGRFSPEKLVSVERADTERYFLNEGELVFARTGASVGKSYLYDPADGRLVFAGFLIRVRANAAKLVPSFLAAYVKTGRYWNWVKIMSMRSGQPGINGNEYAQLPIPLPTVEEQSAIAAVLSDMDAEISALEQRREKTRAIKQGIMQELLTGKTRLI